MQLFIGSKHSHLITLNNELWSQQFLPWVIGSVCGSCSQRDTDVVRFVPMSKCAVMLFDDTFTLLQVLNVHPVGGTDASRE